jgi:hypothetical protein
LTGWWCNNHLEKYESQWEGLSHILWKIKNAPNHQPGLMIFDGIFSGCKREYHGIIKHDKHGKSAIRPEFLRG